MALYSDLILLEASPESIFMKPLTEVQKASWAQGIPTMVLALPQLKPEAVLEMAEKVKDILKKHLPDRTAEIDGVWAAISREAAGRDAFVEDMAARQAGTMEVLPRDGGPVGDIRAFLLDQTIKPFVMAYAEQVVGELELKRWDKGYCPVCGSQPGFSRLSKAVGRRSLYCSLCETEWGYKRVGCPYCHSTDQEKLQYFTVDGEERYRVNICKQCKGYLKMLDESRVPRDEKVYLFLEDVKTMHLDVLAQREGYTHKPVASEN